MLSIIENYQTKNILKKIREKDSVFWERVGQKNTLKLFKKAANYVPAYKDFLINNKIDFNKIKTWSDFQNVPPIDKKNYLQKYPLESLCWHGRINKPMVFTSTSGSTGESFYFPRSHKLDWQSSVTHQWFYDQGKTGSTLVVVAFGMGIWIGGLLTYQAFEILARNGKKPISIITPGINKKEIFKVLRDLAPRFDEVIIAGYPPFLKDLVDGAASNGVDLSSLKIRMVMAAEAFTENFRDYLAQRGKMNVYTDFLHIYGSADIGTMAAESAPSILVKRLALADDRIFVSLFGDLGKSPTVAQFNPLFINFESVDNQLVLSGDSAIPLVRYAIGDRGGICTYNQVKNKFSDFGVNLEEEAGHANLLDKWSQLPMVYVFERLDLSTTLYGVNVYPQIIREALLKDNLQQHVTGKFSIQTKFDNNQDQYLEINLELKEKIEVPDDLGVEARKEIVDALVNKSSEFKELFKVLGERVFPVVNFLSFEHPEHFKPGVKQKWVIK